MDKALPHPHRRRALCCGAAAIAGLFTGLAAEAAPPPWHHWPSPIQDLLDQTFDGLDPAALWDVHAHLLGTGDSGSGCSIHASMTEGWHPLERLRRRFVMGAAGVPDEALAQGGVDRAYVARLRSLADGFPPGARWLLFAFDRALDDAGRERPDWTTFHVPDAYARQVAEAAPGRFGWVASIHPLRPDALVRLDRALAGGALAVKWLPSAMAIDLRDARLRPFYDRLAATRTPLIVHCGEEKAVPGAGRDELGNPLLVRAPLAAGVRVVVAHCASLGEAPDLDQRRPTQRPAFELFARLMDEPEWRDRLLGDVSALFQVNRRAEVWRTVLQREDWHPRLLHGSDYPLPGVRLLYSTGRLVREGLLSPAQVGPLERLREHNPLLFDLALKRQVAWRGQRLSAAVFDTRRHFDHAAKSTA
ncbi:MAG: amidohydrolase family protein [Burkholderiaceae bacterium]